MKEKVQGYIMVNLVSGKLFLWEHTQYIENDNVLEEISILDPYSGTEIDIVIENGIMQTPIIKGYITSWIIKHGIHEEEIDYLLDNIQDLILVSEIIAEYKDELEW